MQGEFSHFFMLDPPDGGDPFSLEDDEVDEVYPILDDSDLLDYDNASPNMYALDLGPDIYLLGEDIGPTSKQEKRFFADADESRYIETRMPDGVHCMDDRVTKPGLQLPGGLVETWIVSSYMNPHMPPLPISEAYERFVPDLLGKGARLWVHGGCAAGGLKRNALMATAHNDEVANAFTYEVMRAMDLNYDEDITRRAITTGGKRAQNERLWDKSFTWGLRVARSHQGVEYEEFVVGHKAAGLRLDATTNLFDNARFREEHVIDGEEVGLLSVTLGAYRELLQNQMGFNEAEMTREIMHATLFTFGLARVIGNQYLRAGIVIDRK